VLEHSCLLEKYLKELAHSAELGPLLDLACGTGRNGLYLVDNTIPVVFADADEAALSQVRATISGAGCGADNTLVQLWPVNLEKNNVNPLANSRFGGILVFRYLHRPLMESIRQAVLPGGIVIYETFTVDQAELGRPKNPDYLLRHDELRDYFIDWNVLHYFEGVQGQPELGSQQAIAQVVAIKPA